MNIKHLFLLLLTFVLVGCNNTNTSTPLEVETVKCDIKLSIDINNSNLLYEDKIENLFSDLINSSYEIDHIKDSYTVGFIFNEEVTNLKLSAGFFRNLDTDMCRFKEVEYKLDGNLLSYTFESKNIDNHDVIHHVFKLEFNDKIGYLALNYGQQYYHLSNNLHWINAVAKGNISSIEYTRNIDSDNQLTFITKDNMIKEKFVSFLDESYCNYVPTIKNDFTNKIVVNTIAGKSYEMEFDDDGQMATICILSQGNPIEELANMFYKEEVTIDVIYPTLAKISANEISKINIVQTTDDHNNDYNIDITQTSKINELYSHFINNSYQYDYTGKSNKDGGYKQTITIHYKESTLTIKVVNGCIISENNMPYTSKNDLPDFS